MPQTIFITGVSSGFGKLTVPLLLEKKHTVIAGLRGGHTRLELLFPEEMKRFKGRLHAIELSLEKPSDLTQAAHLVQNQFGGKLDVLINNAGYGLMGVLEDQTEEQVRYQMEINFFGTAFLTRALLPALRNARGRVLSVSSMAGRDGFPFYGSYAASKFALEGLMECMYHDLKPFGVQIGLIEPGGFRTSFVQAKQYGAHSNETTSPYYERTRAFGKAFEMTAARLDDPAKVARLISHLCDVKRVPLRNPIGRDAALMRVLNILLPERARLALVDAVFKRALAHTKSKH